MTGNIFSDALFIFLIVYAIVHICYEIGAFLLEKFSLYHHRDFLILSVSPGHEELELDIRMAIKRSVEKHCSLLILDRGLSPEEQMILWRLTDPYQHIVLTTEQDLMESIKVADAVNEAL